MPRGVWKALLWTSLAMLFCCCGALSSGRLSVVPAPKPEPSLWWSLYGGEATKVLGFYCGFKRNVWHRVHATGGLKSAPVDLSGHAVSLLRCFVFWAAKTLGFYCGFKRNVWHRADATGGLKSAPVDLSGHAVSLLRCSVFWASFCSPGAKTWAITMVESLLYGAEATKTLGFYCAWWLSVWGPAWVKRLEAKTRGFYWSRHIGCYTGDSGPKPKFSIADSGATFGIQGGGNAV